MLISLFANVFAQETEQAISAKLKVESKLSTLPAEKTSVIQQEQSALSVTDSSSDLVGEGDQLLITVFGQSDLSADVIVGPTGIITLPLVGTISIKGKTANEVASIFASKLEQGQYLLNPKVSVKINQQVSRSFSVIGEVLRPGRFPLQGQMSIVEALSLAGGVTPRADKHLKVLRRMSQNGQTELREFTSMKLDFDDEKNNDSLMQKILPNDVLIIGQQKNFYVYGEIRRPGMYPMEDDLNIVRVLSIGGGVTERGSASRIIIHRKSDSGELKEIPAQISDPVLPGDVVMIKERIF
ncbi:SLBB domain-containing protein [Undibacterium sp. FT147W]|uniref:SLBB domain-containing protein n=1 Tax=Undibacterium rivi TaxID=2828729 RepID=A0ABS5H1L3_9BURK|nr:SLBB domain-containing protein [Undibacterium rivi]MBR7792272.1 SLBB domain-containing protein [Undibacterium rivi]